MQFVSDILMRTVTFHTDWLTEHERWPPRSGTTYLYVKLYFREKRNGSEWPIEIPLSNVDNKSYADWPPQSWVTDIKYERFLAGCSLEKSKWLWMAKSDKAFYGDSLPRDLSNRAKKGRDLAQKPSRLLQEVS
jgi:hypothetical protein